MQLAEWQDSVYTISTNAFNPDAYIRRESTLSYHVVAKGQTIQQIAARYGVSVSNLKKWNNLKSTKLKAGKKLRIFTSDEVIMPVASTGSIGFYYYISDYESQTIQDICGRFPEFDLEKTSALNHIDTPQTPIGKGKLIKLYTTLK
jgi:LysM repeat protein